VRPERGEHDPPPTEMYTPLSSMPDSGSWMSTEGDIDATRRVESTAQDPGVTISRGAWIVVTSDQ